jgi:hypothetical protein
VPHPSPPPGRHQSEKVTVSEQKQSQRPWFGQWTVYWCDDKDSSIPEVTVHKAWEQRADRPVSPRGICVMCNLTTVHTILRIRMKILSDATGYGFSEPENSFKLQFEIVFIFSQTPTKHSFYRLGVPNKYLQLKR